MRGWRSAGPPSDGLGRTRASGAAPPAADIGDLFRDLRRALKLSLPELASRLGTRIEVLTALEKGDIRRLPSWAETARVVTEYTAMARIDPRPVLVVLADRMGARRAARGLPGTSTGVARWGGLARRVGAAVRAAMPVERRRLGRAEVEVSRWQSNVTALRRTIVAALAALALSVAAYYVRTGGLKATIASLPPPLARLAHSAEDYILWQAAPTRDGFKWIDVDDPRTRRADKLKISPR